MKIFKMPLIKLENSTNLGVILVVGVGASV